MSLKILFIDDELQLCELFKNAVSDSERDYDVKFALNAKDAIVHLKEQHFDAVVVDINLPDLSGMDVAKLAQKSNQKSKIIVISGDLDLREKSKSHLLGVHATLQKPFQMLDLMDLLEKQPDEATVFQDTEMLALPIEFVHKEKSYPFDIFIKINDSKYLKIFPKNQACGSDRIDRFYQEKRQYLFVHKDDYLTMADKFFVPIRLIQIVPERPVPFHVFDSIDDNLFEVEISSGDAPTKAQLADLKERSRKRLYIYHNDEKLFQKYLDESIRQSMKSEDLPLSEKTQLINDYAVKKMENAFNNPDEQKIKNMDVVQEGLNDYMKLAQANVGAFLLETQSHSGLYQHSVNCAVLSHALLLEMEKFRVSNPNSRFQGMNFATEECQKTLRLASLMHDMGEVIMRREALNGDTEINERKLKKEHASFAIELIEKFDKEKIFSPKTLEVISTHEEFIDGTGPQGRKKGTISLYGQVLSLVNYYDELVTVDKIPLEDAWAQVKENKDKFNPEMLPLLEKLIFEL